MADNIDITNLVALSDADLGTALLDALGRVLDALPSPATATPAGRAACEALSIAMQMQSRRDKATL